MLTISAQCSVPIFGCGTGLGLEEAINQDSPNISISLALASVRMPHSLVLSNLFEPTPDVGTSGATAVVAVQRFVESRLG